MATSLVHSDLRGSLYAISSMAGISVQLPVPPASTEPAKTSDTALECKSEQQQQPPHESDNVSAATTSLMSPKGQQQVFSPSSTTTSTTTSGSKADHHLTQHHHHHFKGKRDSLPMTTFRRSGGEEDGPGGDEEEQQTAFEREHHHHRPQHYHHHPRRTLPTTPTTSVFEEMSKDEDGESEHLVVVANIHKAPSALSTLKEEETPTASTSNASGSLDGDESHLIKSPPPPADEVSHLFLLIMLLSLYLLILCLGFKRIHKCEDVIPHTRCCFTIAHCALLLSLCVSLSPI